MDKYDYTQYLKSMGCLQLGRGSYATVYSHPYCKDRVIKVSQIKDAYPTYLLWAYEQGELGKHAPYIYSFVACSKFCITEMELLTRINYDIVNWKDNGFYDRIYDFSYSYDFGIDIGGTNNMLRGNEIVFTDPVCLGNASFIKDFSFWRKQAYKLASILA